MHPQAQQMDSWLRVVAGMLVIGGTAFWAGEAMLCGPGRAEEPLFPAAQVPARSAARVRDLEVLQDVLGEAADRCNAVESVARDATPECVASLCDLLDSSEPSTVRYAVAGLSKIGSGAKPSVA